MAEVGRPSKQTRLIEYARCVQSPIHYGEKYCQVFDLTKDGMTPFKLFPKQKEFISNCMKHRFNIVLKPRQVGVSTTAALYVSTYAMFTDKRKVLIIANKQDTAHEFLKKVKDFVKYAPIWMGIRIIRETQGLIELNNGSIVKAVATSEDALRGYSPSLLVMDEAAYIDHGENVWAAAQPSLSCLTEDSLILTDKGLVELGDIIKEKNKLGFSDIKNLIVCNKENNLANVTKSFKSEYSITKRIKTKLGLELEGTLKHSIVGKRENEEQWIKFSDICYEDNVKIQFNQNIFGNEDNIKYDIKLRSDAKLLNIPNNLSDNLNFVYLLGLFLAEGNFISSGIAITNGDAFIKDFLINDKSNMGKCFTINRKYHFYINNRHLKEWIIRFGFKKVKAPEKEIPKSLFKCSKRVIVSFLQGMFDGDGCVTSSGEVRYCTSSKKLSSQLQILLLNFGILSTIRKSSYKPGKNSVCTNKDKITTMYNIHIYGKWAKTFFNDIGFRLKRKQNNSIHIMNKLDNSGSIDIEKNIIRSLLKDNNINYKKFRENFRFLENFLYKNKKRISVESANKLIKLLDNTHPTIAYIKNKIQDVNNIYFDEIIKIEDSENDTYDLHVPETNSYISNSLVSHNTGGGAILLSTPSGLDPLYYAIYDAAKNNKNNFHITEFKWYEDPRYNKQIKWFKGDHIISNWLKGTTDEKDFIFFKELEQKGYSPTSNWYEDMCRQLNGDQRKIAQEINCSFLGSGDNVIQEKYIEIQEKENVKTPIRCECFDNNMWIYEDPIKDHQYVNSIDVSRGDSADFSTMVVIDINTNHEVAEYQGKVPPDYLGEMVFEYSNRYQAYTVVDITGGMGVATVLKLLDMGFDKKLLHYDNPKSKVLLEKLKIQKRGEKVPGFNVGANRVLVVQEFERQIRQGEFVVRSKRAIGEMKTFVYRNGRPDHMIGFHDDIILAMAQGLFIVQTSFKNLKRYNEQTKAMLDSISANSNEYKDNITPNTNQTGRNDSKWASQHYSWLLTPFSK